MLTTLSSKELKNILFFHSTCLANLDNIVSSLQMKNLNPQSLKTLPTAPKQVLELDLNTGISGLKVCSVPSFRLPPQHVKAFVSEPTAGAPFSLSPSSWCIPAYPSSSICSMWLSLTHAGLSPLMTLHSNNRAMLAYLWSKSITLTPPTWHLPNYISVICMCLCCLLYTVSSFTEKL